MLEIQELERFDEILAVILAVECRFVLGEYSMEF